MRRYLILGILSVLAACATVPSYQEEDIFGKFTWLDHGDFYALEWDVEVSNVSLPGKDPEEGKFISRARKLCDGDTHSRSYIAPRASRSEYVQPTGHNVYIPISRTRTVAGGIFHCTNNPAHNR